MKIRRYLPFQLFISIIGSLFLFADVAWTKDAALENAPGAVGLSGVKITASEEAIIDLNNRGYILLNQGNASTAEQLFKQALSQTYLRKQASPTLLIASLNGIGLCNFQERKFTEAQKAYLEAEKLIDANPTEDGHVHAMVLNNLGQAYRNQLQLELAQPYYEQAIKIEAGLPNPDRRFLASVSCNLGLLYFQQKRYAEAEPVFTQGMSVLRDTAGESDPGYESYIPYYKAVLEANGHTSSIPGI